MYKFILTIALYSCSLFAWGQDAKFWHWKDLEKDGVHGVSLFKAQQLIKDLKLNRALITCSILIILQEEQQGIQAQVSFQVSQEPSMVYYRLSCRRVLCPKKSKSQ